jgi:hypothetical protein
MHAGLSRGPSKMVIVGREGKYVYPKPVRTIARGVIVLGVSLKTAPPGNARSQASTGEADGVTAGGRRTTLHSPATSATCSWTKLCAAKANTNVILGIAASTEEF